jgi:SAM-dependent methyltransferase
MIDYAGRMERLRRIIQNAQRDLDVARMILREAVGILTALGATNRGAREVIGKSLAEQEITDLARFEQNLHDIVYGIGSQNKFCNSGDLPSAMSDRANLWCKSILPHLGFNTDDSTLDLGGGSGELAYRISIATDQHRPVSIADVLDWRMHKLPFFTVANNRVDADDASFSQVVVVTVFHHSDDPAALIVEAFRLARHRVIIVESVTEDLPMYLYASWIDWFYNHIIHFSPDIEKKINVPCNFLPATAWEQLIWKLTGLRPSVSKSLGIFQFLNPEQHYLLVYDK